MWSGTDYNFENDLTEGFTRSVKSGLLLSEAPDYDKGDLECPFFCTAIKHIIARDCESRGYLNNQSRSKVFNEEGLQKVILKLEKR